jgi:hypothetical protein
MTPPQPSLMTPHFWPVGQAVILLQVPHWKVSASHVPLLPHAGQLSVPPHPSLGLPHWKPSVAHVPFVHALQVCVVGSHVSPVLQVPQVFTFPQLFRKTPHWPGWHPWPGAMHCMLVGSQMVPRLQLPHMSVAPQPSG